MDRYYTNYVNKNAKTYLFYKTYIHNLAMLLLMVASPECKQYYCTLTPLKLICIKINKIIFLSLKLFNNSYLIKLMILTGTENCRRRGYG